MTDILLSVRKAAILARCASLLLRVSGFAGHSRMAQSGEAGILSTRQEVYNLIRMKQPGFEDSPEMTGIHGYYFFRLPIGFQGFLEPGGHSFIFG